MSAPSEFDIDAIIERAERHERLDDELVRRLGAIDATGAISDDVIVDHDDDPAAAAARIIVRHLEVGPIPHLAAGGSTPYRVRAYLRGAGALNRLVRVGPGWSRQLDAPAIGFLGPERTPVALLPGPDGSARRADGTSVEDESVFASRIVITQPSLLHAQLRPTAGYRRMARGHVADIAIAIVGLVLAAVLGLVLPLSASVLLDQIIPFDQAGRLAVLTPVLISVPIVVGLVTWWAQRLVVRSRTMIDRRVAVAVWERVLALPASFFSGRSVSEVSAMAHVTGKLHGSIPDAVVVTGVAGVIGLVNLAFIARSGAAIAILTIVIGVGVLWTIVRINLGSRRHIAELVAARVRSQNMLRQMIEAVAKLRVSASETRVVHRWTALLGHEQAQAARVLERDLHLRVLLAAVPIIGALVLVLAAPSAPGNAGAFVAMYVALNQAVAAMAAIGTSWAAVVRVTPLIDQVRPVLDCPPEVPATPRPPLELVGRIEVDDVTFTYHPERPPVFADLSFTIEAGSMVALVGPSGAGKSTILRLLLGFEHPSIGVIRYDGYPIDELDPVDLRRQIGVVLQQARLLPGSIRTNIAAGRVLDDDAIWAAVRNASLEADIASMPMGLETIVSEGASTLSGGQRQRIIIARALAGRPAMMFFDEATSALDNLSQARVTESLEQLGITRLVIAHRLSTIERADRILVLWDGRIVEQGTYRELIAVDGRFAELARRQLA